VQKNGTAVGYLPRTPLTALHDSLSGFKGSLRGREGKRKQEREGENGKGGEMKLGRART